MGKYYWIFGGIAGGFSVLSEFLLFSGKLGFHRSSGVLMSKLGMLLICIIFGAILIKKMNGSISMARTMLSGTLIALICAAISIGGYTSMSEVDKNFFDKAKTYNIQIWEEQNADNPEELAKKEDKVQQIEQSYSLQQYAGFTLVGYLVSGLIVSLFTAAFLANKSAFTANQ